MLYVLMFAFVVVKSGESNLPWYIPYLHSIFWIIIGNSWSRSHKDIIVNRITKQLIYLFLGTQIVFWGFSVFGYLFNSNYMSSNIITRAISTTAQSLLTFLSVAAACKIFKEKIVHYSLIALILKHTVVIIVSALSYGVGRFLPVVLLPFKYDEVWSVSMMIASIEMHDLTFALGFIVIYLFEFINEFHPTKKEKKKYIWAILVTIAFIYIGYKRIQLLALLAIIGASFLIRGKTKRGIRQWTIIVLVVEIVILYGYIWIIDSGVLNNLLILFELNSRGRIEAYNAMSNLFTFSPFYIGRGKESGVRLKEALYGNTVLLGHSDVLYAFIDFGFWGFGVWIFYCFYFVTQKLNRIYGNKEARMWLLCTIYAFVTYLTDNTLTYFAFQTMYFAVMFSYIYLIKIKNEKPLSWIR